MNGRDAEYPGPAHSLSPHDLVQQVVIRCYKVIAHVILAELLKELAGTPDLRLLDALEVKGLQRALGLGDEEDVLHRALVEGDGPVGRVVAHGAWES